MRCCVALHRESGFIASSACSDRDRRAALALSPQLSPRPRQERRRARAPVPTRGRDESLGCGPVSNYSRFELRLGEDFQCALHQRTVALRSGMMFASISCDMMLCRCRQGHPIDKPKWMSLRTELTYLAQVGLLWQHAPCSLQLTNEPSSLQVHQVV